MTDQALIESIADDRDELVALTLELSALPDLAGHERPVAEYVAGWSEDHGMPAALQELGRASANVVVSVERPRSGDLPELMLNAHLDTEGGPPSGSAEEVRRLRGAWREDGRLVGKGLVNDRVQLAAQLIAARALRRGGVPLPGGLTIAGVAQETGGPVPSEPPGTGGARDEPPHHGEGSGTRALLANGTACRRAIVGEPTGFAIGGGQCGFIRFRIDVRGQMLYTPFLERGVGGANPYEAAGRLVVDLTAWCDDFERRHTTSFWGGTMVPKAQVVGVRSWGYPFTDREDRCLVFIDVRTPPELDTDVITAEIGHLLPSSFSSRIVVIDAHPGFIAPEGDATVAALREAHQIVHGAPPLPPAAPQVSMWQDTNAYLAAGIPAVSYGVRVQPDSDTLEGRRAVLIDDAVALAQTYALAAHRICGERP